MIVDKILRLSGAPAYAVIFALPALEASLFLGFVFPGEIAVLFGGVLAYQGRISLAGAIAAAVAGAIIGDTIGYEVGRRYGERLLDGPLRRVVKQHHRERATAFLQRNGGKAVFFGRFTAALRVMIPGLAGIAQIPYPTFFLFNALGGLIWATGFTLLGYAAGNGYRRVEHVIGRASQIVIGLLATGLVIFLTARWFARHPERVRAWWARQQQRALVRTLARGLDFLAARFRPGEAFGLGLTLGLVFVAAVGVAFGVVVQDVARRQELVHIDRPLLDALVRHSEGGLTAFMKGVSALGSVRFIAAASLILLVVLGVRKLWTQSTLALAAPLGAIVLAEMVKLIVRRPRPPLHALIHASRYSFPSVQAAGSLAFYGAVALLLLKMKRSWTRNVAIWAAATALIALIGFSQSYLRVAYPTDVLGGFLLAALWLAIVVSGVRVRQRAQRRETAEAMPA